MSCLLPAINYFFVLSPRYCIKNIVCILTYSVILSERVEQIIICTNIFLGYVTKHRDPSLDDFPDVGKWPIHVQISHYAGICSKRLDRIGDTGRLRPKKPTVDDIDQSRLQIFRPSMFGGTLSETMDMQRERFPHKRLPWILTVLSEQILQLNGAKTEGIFRVPADHDEVINVKRYLDLLFL